MRVRSGTFYGAWQKLLEGVMTNGVECAPRGMKIKEVLGTQLVVEDLRANIIVDPNRDLNYRFMVAEWLWIRDGRNDVRWIEKYNSQITRFSDDGVTFRGAYGPKLRKQWRYLLDSVLNDPDTRQAVATIWEPGFEQPTKDVPCTCMLQVLLRGGKLHGIVTMRSNDLWLGLPYDFFNFSQIVNGLAGDLNVAPGSMTLQAGSSHLYEPNWSAADNVLNANAGMTQWSPILPCSPPNGLTELVDHPGDHWPLPNQYEGYLNVLRAPNKATALRILETI